VTWIKSPPLFGLAAALILGTACSGGNDALSGWDGVERDSAGITIVENFGTPLWGDEPLWTFHEVLRIGTADGDPDYQFGRITGLAVLSDRRVAVADQLAHNVRYFSPEGELERTVGRQGSGPGEFGSRALYLVRMKGDTILVIDNGNNRVVHVFAPDGTQLAGFSLAPRDGYRAVNWDQDLAGRLAVGWEAIVRPDMPLADTLTHIVEVDLRGEIIDTLGRAPSPQAAVIEGDTRLRYYYRGEVGYDFCGGGIWIGSSDEYRMTWFGPSGDPERVMSLARESVPMDGRDEAVMMAWYDEVLQANQVPQGRATDIKSRVRFEGAYPMYRRFVCGPENVLMVQRFVPLRDLQPTKDNNPLRVGPVTAGRPPPDDTWDVFDVNGRYLGVVDPPWDHVWRAGQFVRAPDGGWYMYAVMQDELDVEYVVAWRVEGRMPTQTE
jgi:hypothetical protein